MISELLRAIEDGEDILILAGGLLRVCREHLDALRVTDADPGAWRDREALRRRVEEFFRDVDDEELDRDEREELAAIAEQWSEDLPAVAVAHTIAEALDAVLGSRLLPMFLGHRVTLKPGDPVPMPHPDWRGLVSAPDDDLRDPVDRLDAIPHLRLASGWANDIDVTIDGNWRLWHVLPQLTGGDRLACATPNRAFDELIVQRDNRDGSPIWFAARFGSDPNEQSARLLALLDLARDHRCRVVAFPELTVTEPMRASIATWLDDQDIVDLVVAGSCHTPTQDGDWRNQSTMLVRGIAEPIVHDKFAPLSLVDPDSADAAPAREHLARAKPAILAHLSPHWTTVLLVGSDVIHEPVPRVLADMHANFLLVPTLGFDMAPYQAVAASQATWSHGVTLIANACVACDEQNSRPPAVLGLPSQMGKIISEAPPPLSLLIATIGSLTKKPSIVVMPEIC